MDWHHHVTSELIEEQLAARRASAARERLYLAHRAPRTPLRVAIGRALIRLGSRIAGPDVAARTTMGHRHPAPG